MQRNFLSNFHYLNKLSSLEILTLILIMIAHKFNIKRLTTPSKHATQVPTKTMPYSRIYCNHYSHFSIFIISLLAITPPKNGYNLLKFVYLHHWNGWSSDVINISKNKNVGKYHIIVNLGT